MKKWMMTDVFFIATFCLCGCGMLGKQRALVRGRESMAKEKQLDAFISAHVEKIKPMWRAAALASWQASITGKTEDYDKMKELELAIRTVYSNAAEFAYLKEMKESGQIGDPILARQLELLYYGYLSNQIEPGLLKQMVDLDARIAQRFHTYRATMEGTTVTVNDIKAILTTEKNSRRRELAWRASKQVGNEIVADLLQLVRLRNQAARKLGFDNFRTLRLTTGEQDPKELDRIFGELCELTDKSFAIAKADLDRVLAEQYGISPGELMPWHYHDPFFQRAPLVYGQGLDEFYKDADVRQLAEKFYAGIGLSVDDVLQRSDLYERKGKDQGAYSTDIDREGDVRILTNLKNNENWMETALHELGHAAYSKNHDRAEPFLLRDATHSFCTEAVAMFFGRLSRNAFWMQEMLGLSAAQRSQIEKVSAKYLELQQLIAARWMMVMYYFEKQLYTNPDQDLNSLWWDLVEKYQLLKRPPMPPDAGWASKGHFTTSPCYYHNYMLGELLASQWHHYIVHNVLGLGADAGVSYVGQKKVGAYFREEVFAPGIKYHWDEMIRRATGEPLTPKYFVEQFVR
ncbi:M3 family oligoendopeptidase [Candidatus Sumerlaeota bacterium]|nr:M3 family oligoendopeptidase [Candidatus Sumerlaeota bacterium]